jgi:hypothetical protein
VSLHGETGPFLAVSPISWLPTKRRSVLLRTLPVNTPVRVLETQDGWLKVEFRDGQLGARVGYMEAKYLRVFQPAAALASPAAVPASPVAPAAPVTTPAAPAFDPQPRPPAREPVSASDTSIEPPSASGPTLNDESVAAAIRAGQNKKYADLISFCVATSGFSESLGAGMTGGIQPTGSFDVVVSLAPGRIAFAAADAKRLYKPFTVADVPADMRDTSKVFCHSGSARTLRFGPFTASLRRLNKLC